MLYLFNYKNKFSNLFIILLSVVVHLNQLLYTNNKIIDVHTNFIANYIEHFLFNLNKINSFIVYQFLILSQGFILNYFFRDKKLFPKDNNYIFLLYILFAALIPAANVLSFSLIINYFNIIICVNLFTIFHHKKINSFIYNTSFLIGFSIFLYPPNFILFPILLIAILLFLPFNIRNWFYLIMGLLTPSYILYAYYYLTNNMQYFINSILQYTSHINKQSFIIKPIFIIDYIFLTLSFIIGFYLFQINNKRFLIQIRKFWILILIFTIISVIVTNIFINIFPTSFVFLLFPLSAFTVHIFEFNYERKKLLSFYFLFILVLIFKNWG